MSKKKEESFFDDAAERAAEQAETEAEQQNAPWWNFEGKGGEEAQPMFKGSFVSAEMKEKKGTNNQPYICLFVYLRDLEGTLYKAWLSASGAVRGLQDAAPAPGSLLFIKYEGEKESSTTQGRKFKSYSVIADVQDPDYWTSVAKAFASRNVEVTAKAAPTLDPNEAPF